MSQVWLITGSASGLGRAIADAALAADNRVIASARNHARLDDLVVRYGEAVRAIPLDVTDEAQGVRAVQAALDAFGRLDVLVNNAGYGESSPFEEMPPASFRRLVETVFFGTVNLTRAALPIMRRQRSGLILQISSAGGRFAGPGQAAYHAAKWAVGGFTDSVRAEAAPFGVRLATLEPGAIRTDWGRRAYDDRPPVGQDYRASVGAAQSHLAGLWGNEPIDPEKFATLIVRLAGMDDLPARLLIGAHILDMIEQAEDERRAELNRWRPVSEAVEYGATASVDTVQPRAAPLSGTDAA